MSHAVKRRLLISTDLDATLLDHETYSYAAAVPVLEQLKRLECPIIFNSSKTEAEQTQLREALDIQDPFIIENGSAVMIPEGQLKGCPACQRFGPPYRDLVDQLAQLKQQHGYRFRGFSDLSAADIAQMTGLPLAGAQAAKQRSASEPLCWDDSETAYDSFVTTVTALGLQTTSGGRFRHVMAQTDKGHALKWLVNCYRNCWPAVDWVVVALGDSPNDLPMLQVADVGVLIKNPHRDSFEVGRIKHLVRPSEPGPAGWAEAISILIKTQLTEA